MAKKKSRKVGQIGIPKSSIPIVRTPSDRVRKKKGNKPGTRNSVIETKQEAASKEKKDSRIGSKEPIDLLRHKNPGIVKTTAPKIKYKTPQHELDAIEADDKLQSLLDKAENKALTKMEQSYVDTKLARHKTLCAMLGIDLEDESEEETDPLQGLDAISMDDFKD
ncbi:MULTISPECIES: Der GTPase-activating protein YihI [Alteromonadaceae]|jgi:ribosome assembly protein YihI (activator of Der GTPase)|uniref:Der GTPase-activating protein YihI n=1 Tax=Brumicola blandensis TaxID=3075611 RepID=A0AAW8R8M9_9ALTE|nr:MULTISPECIES: Der GTPase-activating protein YihI [unclassified Alteromonas]MDT0584258.1 Der GTPase-activating protein YihI [Alteromonas sp. W409]MDT0630040.1 Der GTPase-activating protein YihI [Alteromonas sp. W364]